MTHIKITKTQATKLQKELDKYSRIKENLTLGIIENSINNKIKNVKKKNLKYIVIENTYSVSGAYKFRKQYIQFRCEFTKTGSPQINIFKEGAKTCAYGGGYDVEVIPQYSLITETLGIQRSSHSDKICEAIVNEIVRGGF